MSALIRMVDQPGSQTFLTVIEILVDDGNVQQIHDVSEDFARIRTKMQGASLSPHSGRSTRQEIEAWIKKTFRLDQDPRDRSSDFRVVRGNAGDSSSDAAENTWGTLIEGIASFHD